MTSVYGINNYSIYYETIRYQDSSSNQYTYVSVFQFLFLRLFMLLVALVSFVAVIWYTTERRKQEWSIRYAMGRSKTQLIGYIFFENLIILIGAFIIALVIFFSHRHFTVETFDTIFTIPAVTVTALLMLIFLSIGILIPSRKIKQLDLSELLKSE